MSLSLRAASVVAFLFACAPLPAASLLIKRSQPSSATETLRALDVNGDGVVTLAEVKNFATSQGLSEAEAEDEFRGLDMNGDGHLETNEIAASLKDQRATPAEAESQAPVVEARQTAVAVAAEPRVALPVTSSSANETAEAMQLRSAAQQVKIRASHIVAQELAKLIEEVTDAYQKDSQQAEDLEKKAKVFRAEATELAHAAPGQVEDAATLAAEPKVKAAMESLSKREQDATRAESEAERLRSEAKLYLNKALEAKANVASGVQRVMLRATSARQGQ